MAGAHVAIHAAQEAAKALEEEEMEMTKYTDKDMAEEWEFKIVRSATGTFKKLDVMQRVVEEESQAGWVLLEKFDDKRLRFKRPMSARSKDAMLPQGVDPYRANYGISEGAMGATIALSIMGLIGVFVLILFLAGELN